MTERERKFLRVDTINNLTDKYRNLFINEFEFEGFDYGVSDYFMKKILKSGRVAAFNMTKADILGLGTFAAKSYDWKGDPIYVKIVNEYGNKLIPTKYLINNKEVVLLDLGFIPERYISEYVRRIIDIQDTIDTNLTLQKIPFIIKSTDAKTIKAIKDLMEGYSIIFAEDEMIDALDLKVDYLIDKLQLFKKETEAELLAILGIDGINFEKKAQMTKDEVNSNEDEIDAYRKLIRSRIEVFLKQIKEVLGHNITLINDNENDSQIIEEGEDYV